MLSRRMMSKGFMASIVGLANFQAIRANSRPAVEPRSPTKGIYAKRGEKTYCAKGCEIGHFGNDVYTGAMPKTGDLVPVDGMSLGMSKCPFCTATVTSELSLYYFKSKA